MKKAMFITALVALGGLVAIVIANLIYFYSDYDSPAEAFSFVLSDFSSFTSGISYFVLSVLAIVNYFRK
jgi:hypothetical protein